MPASPPSRTTRPLPLRAAWKAATSEPISALRPTKELSTRAARAGTISMGATKRTPCARIDST
jgi:hypothetical protein